MFWWKRNSWARACWGSFFFLKCVSCVGGLDLLNYLDRSPSRWLSCHMCRRVVIMFCCRSVWLSVLSSDLNVYLLVSFLFLFQFLREELKYENGYEKRQRAFHRDDDMHISVRELWDIWIRSEVHNWTTQQTVDWLVHLVQLPQYSAAFTQQNIDGSKLPRYVTLHCLTWQIRGRVTMWKICMGCSLGCFEGWGLGQRSTVGT